MMVSTLATTVARVKFLIAKDVFTDDEFKAQLAPSAGELSGRPETVTVDLNATNPLESFTLSESLYCHVDKMFVARIVPLRITARLRCHSLIMKYPVSL